MHVIGRGQHAFITGSGGGVGLGRTSLAVQFAHSMRATFPDGVLWVSGNPFDPYLTALRLAATLGIDLRPLAPPGDAAHALESLLAGKRLLLVLDDVTDTRLLKMLPPIGPAVIITGSDPSLVQAAPSAIISLEAWSEEDADQFLQRALGPERWRLEPVAAREVAFLLGYHPLAITMALAALEADAPVSGPVLATLARDLRNRLGRLQRFSGESRWMGGAFTSALEVLSPTERTFLHALSALPVTGFVLEAACAVGHTTAAEGAESLSRLVRLHLVQRLEDDRLGLHPLIGDLVRGLAPLDAPRGLAASYYLSHALSHSDDLTQIDQEIDGILSSMTWAMEKGEARLVKEFAIALGPYFDARGFKEEVPRRMQWGLAAARASHDARAEGRVNRWLGRMFMRRSAPEAARERLEAAVSLANETADASGKIAALLDLGRLEIESGQADAAIEALEQAQRMTAGRHADEGRVLFELTRALQLSGRLREAQDRLEACEAWATKRHDAALQAEAESVRQSLNSQSTRSAAPIEVSAVMQQLEAATREPIHAGPSIQDPLPEDPHPDPAPELALSRSLQGLIDPMGHDQSSESPTPAGAANQAPDELDKLEALAAVQLKKGAPEAALVTLLQVAGAAELEGDQERAAGVLEQAGKLMVARGEINRALTHYEKSFRLREAAGDTGGAARTLHQMGRVATEVGDYDSAMYHFLRGLDRQESMADDKGRAEALFRLGVIFAARGDYEDALAHYEVSEELWLEARDLQGLAAVLQAIGRIHAHKGNRELAARYYSRSLELADALQDDRLRAGVLHQLGGLAVDLGDYQAGMSHYRRSLGLKRAVGDLRGMAVTLHAMAQLEATQGRSAEARGYYQRVLEIARGLNAPRVTAATLRALGDVEAREGQLPAALSAYQEAARLQTTLGEKREIAAINHGMGTVKAEQGDIPGALSHLRTSLELSRELADRRGEAATLYQLGIALAEESQDDEALESLRASLSIDDALGNRRGVAMTSAMLGQVLAAAGHREQARVIFQQALNRMEMLNMSEADTVRTWLESTT